MGIRNFVKEALSFGKILSCKIVYGKRLQVAMRQLWGKGTKIVVTGRGKLIIGEQLEARRMDYLNVQSGEMRIGDHVFMNQNVSVTCLEKVEIGDKCIIANNVVIVDHDHDLEHGGFATAPVRLERGAWIGANVTILKGVTIGEGAIVAAGSVVNKSVPPHTMVAGVPARVLKQMNFKNEQMA